MSTVLMICPRCDDEIVLDTDRLILRAQVGSRPTGELLYSCPACGGSCASDIRSDLLAWLLLVGAQPVMLEEPHLERRDPRPVTAPFTLDDVLTWHEQLQSVAFITPWE